MGEIYRHYANKDSMILWNPFMSFRFIPETITENGTDCPKVMISIGRRVKDNLDNEKIKLLPKKIQNEISKKFILETLNQNLTIRDKFVNMLAGTAQWFQLKLLGVKFTRTENSFEVYQFLKFSELNELLELGYGFGLAFKKLNATPGQVQAFCNNVLRMYQKDNPKANVI